MQVDVPDPGNSAMCTAVPDLKATLGLQQDPNSQTWLAIDAGVLLAWLIFYRALVYIALRYKTARR